jgi:flagellar biogenesis protein FliO
VRLLAVFAVLSASALAAEPAADRHAFENEPVFGADGDGAPSDSKATTPDGALASLAGTAVLLVLVMCGLLYCVKRFAPGAKALRGAGAIEVLARRAIAPQAQMMLVAVGKKVLRVGLTKDGMSYLGEVADPDEIALIRGQAAGTADGEFKESLRAKAEPAPPPEALPPPPSEPAPLPDLDSLRRSVESWRKAAAL